MAADEELAWGYFSASAEDREWAVTRNLERIQARTLSILRSEIRPASPLRYQAETLWLHHLTPRRKLTGMDGLREALTQLRGLAAPAADWTSRILPARVTGFSVAMLDRLLRDGEFVAVPDVAGGSPITSVRILPRSEGNAFLPDAQLEMVQEVQKSDVVGGVRAHITASVRKFILGEGAATSVDIRIAFGTASLGELRSALAELVSDGIITSDSWQALLGVMQPAASQTALSSQTMLQQPVTSLRQRSQARRQAARRVKELTAALPQDARWLPVSRFGVLGPELDASRRAQMRAEALLRRHGVVTRLALELEGDAWEWPPIANALSLMELRGSVRRGYFVLGLPGVQFALPEMVERLRTASRPGADDFTVVRLTDPAYVMDRTLAESVDEADARLLRASRLPSSDLVFHGDRPVLLSESNGERLTPALDATLQNSLPASLRTLRDHRVPHAGSYAQQMTVREWAGRPVLESDGAKLLEEAGFRRDYPAMTFDAVQASVLSGR
jgi:ATP-dependent Lhr-like helicase